ncbi:uncharacterized protein LOC129731990 isoform X3 [Wyeomyia smithii]|uniref:uncharacterized protein LOC129731990 isoform X3 n=1 Tax=Wyeomyia smithii TaxID=174621 RepID=UPI002467C14A|nr:uncharacterized protein LOC129731990 isoform X3 [Wyeomyia smithii]
MEQVEALLDAESFQKLKAKKIDDISLVLLKDTDLRDIGINEKGPRMVILQIIENLNSSHDNVNDKENTTNVIIPPSKQILRETLVSDNSFRLKVLQPVLDRGNIPDKNGISFLTRVACQPFEKRIKDGHVCFRVVVRHSYDVTGPPQLIDFRQVCNGVLSKQRVQLMVHALSTLSVVHLYSTVDSPQRFPFENSKNVKAFCHKRRCIGSVEDYRPYQVHRQLFALDSIEKVMSEPIAAPQLVRTFVCLRRTGCQ